MAMLPVLQRAVTRSDRVCPSAVRPRARVGISRARPERMIASCRSPSVCLPSASHASALRAYRLPGRAAHKRDRHPHGAWRTANGSVVGPFFGGRSYGQQAGVALGIPFALTASAQPKPFVLSEPDGHCDAVRAAVLMLTLGALVGVHSGAPRLTRGSDCGFTIRRRERRCFGFRSAFFVQR